MAKQLDDRCEVACVNEEKVAAVRPKLAGSEGIGLFFKALADETRAQIALALSLEELCVCDVAALMGVSEATASHHLRLLRNMGLVKYRRDGKLIYYSLDDAHVVGLIQLALDHFREQKSRP